LRFSAIDNSTWGKARKSAKAQAGCFDQARSKLPYSGGMQIYRGIAGASMQFTIGLLGLGGFKRKQGWV
jgi:hypothetical protein